MEANNRIISKNSLGYIYKLKELGDKYQDDKNYVLSNQNYKEALEKWEELEIEKYFDELSVFFQSEKSITDLIFLPY